MEDHKLTEVTTNRSDLTISDGELMVSGGESESTIECNCGEEFEDDDDAIDHMQEQEHDVITRFKDDADFIVKYYQDFGNIMSVDLNWRDDFGGKVPYHVMKAVDDEGYVVSGVHTGIDGTDARLWIREDFKD